MATDRIHAIDLARGMALVAMVIFHFLYDLTMFGILPDGTMKSTFWQHFASLTVGSFLFIAGISLWLAHGAQIRWPSFVKRFCTLVLAAAAISIATYLFKPERFIYFGILHSIAVSSVVGLLFLRLPLFVVLITAGFCFLLPWIYEGAAFDTPWLFWTGLSKARPPSLDYEPFFPWFGVFLLGIAAARSMPFYRSSAIRDVSLTGMSAASVFLAFLGRNSLVVYLTHQPVLVALLWFAVKISECLRWG